jgi:hypothetical protein
MGSFQLGFSKTLYIARLDYLCVKQHLDCFVISMRAQHLKMERDQVYGMSTHINFQVSLSPPLLIL